MSNSPGQKPHKKIGVGVIHNDKEEILISRRLAQGEMGGLWEFPGGKIEQNETDVECVKREIAEELGIEVLVREHLVTIEHQYPKFDVTLFVYNCQYLDGVPQALESAEIRWVVLADLDLLAFPDANYQIITLLKEKQ